MKTSGEEIKQGDVVYLKSGSEALTVNSIDRNIAMVYWFKECGDLAKDQINVACLTIKNTGNS